MDPEKIVNPEPGTAQAQGTEPAKPVDGPKYVTADSLAEFRNSMFADMRKLVEGVTKPKNGKAVQVETQEPPSADVHALIRREREIGEALGEHSHLTREQKSLLRKLVDAEKPDDVAGFVTEHAKTFGRPSGEGATVTTKPPPGNGQTVSAAAPAAPPKFTDDTPLWNLSDEDRARLIKEKGLGWYANTLRAQTKGVRVKLR